MSAAFTDTEVEAIRAIARDEATKLFREMEAATALAVVRNLASQRSRKGSGIK